MPSQEYLKLLDEMKELHCRKSADYGSDADPFANVRASTDIGVAPDMGAWLRAKDKVARIDAYYRNGTLKNEGVEDSLMDLAAYCLICLCLRREKNSE